MQEFEIEKKYFTLLKIGIVCFIAFLVFVLDWVFSFYGDAEFTNRDLILAIIVSFFAGGVLIWSLIALKQLPFHKVAIDDDGIWYVHIGKQKGLINWGKIYKIKERQSLQRLDLYDSNNKKLLKIEYQLLGFELLRDIVNEKATAIPKCNQSEFSKHSLYHLGHWAIFMGPPLISLFIEDHHQAFWFLITTGIMAIFQAYQYFMTLSSIQITNNGFVVVYPATKREILFSDIEDIKISDLFDRDMRRSEVLIASRNAKKPFKLTKLGVDTNVLYRALRQAANL